MKIVQVLTQNHCPDCMKLKMYLEYGLGNKYKDHLQFVHKEENEELYNRLVQEHQIQSTPALIYKKDVVRVFSPLIVQQFLQKHIG